VDAPGDGLLVAAVGEHVPPALAHHDRGAGVLAHRQHAAGRDVGVTQQVQRDEAVVRRRRWIVDNGPQLGQVLRAQVVRDVVHRLRGELGEHRGVDGEEPPAARPLDHIHALVGDQAVLGAIGADRQQRRVLERHGGGHGPSL
jgi:hypothetical protein